MPVRHTVESVAMEIRDSIVGTPRQQRRLRSKTFWDKFRFSYRSKERIAQVQEALQSLGIVWSVDGDALGSESKDAWIVLSTAAPAKPPSSTPGSRTIPFPADAWFEQIGTREYESEREVEYYFILPLLMELGYEEKDFAVGIPVPMWEGVNRVTKEADIVVFNGPGRSPDNALFIVEAKAASRPLTDDSVGQARSYAIWLSTPYYLVTNSLYRGALGADVLLARCDRHALREHWKILYQHLSREAVLAVKEALAAALPKVATPGQG
jgi:hypothetical protein